MTTTAGPVRTADRATPRSIPTPGEYPCGLTWDGRYLWYSDQDALTIDAIDPASGDVVRSFPCEHVRADLAWDGEVLCQVGGRPKRLALVDPVTGADRGERPILPASGRTTGVEFGPDGLWSCLRGPTVVQLRDRATMRVLREHEVPGGGPSGLTWADGRVVYGEFETGELHVVDADTGVHLRTTRVPGRPTGLTWDGDRFWYCDFPGRAIRALGPERVLG